MPQVKGCIPWNKGIKTGYSGSKPCVNGCICGRHTNQQGREGTKCLEGCTCKRHIGHWTGKKMPPMTDETKEKRRVATLKNWQSQEYAHKVLSSNAERPNKTEIYLLNIISPEFHYVGDRRFRIDGKYPDFWNGKNKVIELYGDYWHRGEDPQDRIDLFKKSGYGCLVIWEYELKDIEAVQIKIQAFNEG